MTDDAVSRAMANSPTYLRLAAEAMQEDNVKDLAKAIKPAVTALQDAAARLAALTVAQRDSADGIKAAIAASLAESGVRLREVVSGIEPKMPDMAPIVAAFDRCALEMARHVCAAIDRNTASTIAAVQSLEAAVLAPVQLETNLGVPTGARKVKAKK